ncbi:MAG: AraC family transcriptional regulator [Myxococcota bacterium]
MTLRTPDSTIALILEVPQVRRSFFTKLVGAAAEFARDSNVPFALPLAVEGADPDGFVPLDDLEEILADLAQKLNDPCVGLRVGLLSEVRDLDVLGFVLLNSPTVGEATHNAIRYFALHQTSTEVSCSPGEGHWTVSYRPLGHPKSDLYMDGECTVGVLVAGLAALTGGRSRPSEAHFRRPEPKDAAEYRRLLPDMVVRFGQPVTAVVYDAAVMEAPVVGADDHLLPIVSSHAEFLLSKGAGQDSLQRSLEDAIARSFGAGGLAIDEVARTLGMSKRTLQRRLSERGTTFHELLDKVRERLALQHVRAGTLTLTEIAFVLGYSESSAFGRAFRRWTGASPRDFRRNLRT